MNLNSWMYGGMAVALAVLAWVVYSAVQMPPASSAAVPGVPSTDAPSAASVPSDDSSDCGDLNDPQNIQHLSHHPDRYQDCLRQVDPEAFRQATGQNLNDFLQ